MAGDILAVDQDSSSLYCAHLPKEQPMKKLAWLAVVLLCSASPARATDEVSGSFTVNGKATRFEHVYAFWKPSLFDQTKPDLFVLLSDIAIPAEALPKNDDGVAKMAELVRAGKVHALELHMAPADKGLDPGENAAVYHVGLSPARHGMSGMHVFEPTVFDDKTIEARAHTDGERQSDGVRWSYEARFKVAIPPKPTS
jgi:hypothetical protein